METLRNIGALFIGVAIGMGVWSCAEGAEGPINITRTSAYVKVLFVDSVSEANLVCKDAAQGRFDHHDRVYGCYIPADDICQLVVVRATRWEQYAFLELMGEEMYHCLGAIHE